MLHFSKVLVGPLDAHFILVWSLITPLQSAPSPFPLHFMYNSRLLMILSSFTTSFNQERDRTKSGFWGQFEWGYSGFLLCCFPCFLANFSQFPALAFSFNSCMLPCEMSLSSLVDFLLRQGLFSFSNFHFYQQELRPVLL